ncbi:hypothetical protein Pint_28957 [Pistacia integerrima]|uniref:Uncharacterized protein n=1 Tax=Pistacia integerrima TaxID=434235 RepID=A0ACC0X0P2_9ROSI|nr:hypothetical protein Pint_28957 [Pistacia integerrima]
MQSCPLPPELSTVKQVINFDELLEESINVRSWCITSMAYLIMRHQIPSIEDVLVGLSVFRKPVQGKW